jgi:stage II sporulation protein D
MGFRQFPALVSILLLACLPPLSGFDQTVDDIEFRVLLFSLLKPGSIDVQSPVRGMRASIGNEERECRRLTVRNTAKGRLAVVFDGIDRRSTEMLSLRPEPSGGLIRIRVPSLPERTYSGRLEIAPAGQHLKVIIVLPLREYLYGVVGSEMGSETEALKAQAILSRTYALANRNRHGGDGFDFCDTTHCQHFTGRDRAAAPIRGAVEATAAQVLSGLNRLCGVFFHSTCGGRTNDAGSGYPCLQSIDDGRNCSASPHYRWQLKIPGEKWKSLLRTLAPGGSAEPLSLRVDSCAPGGWVRTVSIAFSDGSSVRVSGEAFHLAMGRRLGWNTFKSANFSVKKEGGSWVFSGKGLGHGIGLCQWGARFLARSGWSCNRILRHYFPLAESRPLPASSADRFTD